MKTLNVVGIDSNHLPNPVNFNIINGQHTKSKNVWRTLDDNSIDESSKNVIQVVSNTTSKMLENAHDQDLEGLLAHTIKNLDSIIATGSDISQYKLMNVKEAPKKCL
uniref:Uncharacterized protein n=1 Tax=Amphimedon queenslandica TaxID=400682 RepID=A0A1X7TRW1_AMPQE